MFNLIPQIILFLALGIVVVLIVKNVPKVKDLDGEDLCSPKKDFFEKQQNILKKIPVERLNDRVDNLMEKALRRIRIGIIKLDALIQKNLNSIKDNSKPKNIFKVDDDVKAEMGQQDEIIDNNVVDSDLFIPESSFDVVDVHEKITIEEEPKEVISEELNTQPETKIKKGRKKKQQVL